MSENEMPQPSCLFFDAAFTLIKPTKPIGQLYAEVAQEFGHDPDGAKLTTHFEDAFRAARKNRRQPTVATTDAESRVFWKAIVEDIFQRSGEAIPPSPYFDTLYDAFATAQFWRVYDDVFPAIDLAVSKGVRIGVITNFDERIFPLMKALDLIQNFEVIVASCEVGLEKPDVAMFRQAEEKLPGVSYGIIGDQLEDDVHGGMKAGWKAVLLDREGDARELSDGVICKNHLVDAVEAILG